MIYSSKAMAKRTVARASPPAASPRVIRRRGTRRTTGGGGRPRSRARTTIRATRLANLGDVASNVREGEGQQLTHQETYDAVVTVGEKLMEGMREEGEKIRAEVRNEAEKTRTVVVDAVKREAEETRAKIAAIEEKNEMGRKELEDERGAVP